MTSVATPVSTTRIMLHVAAAVPGGYAFTWGFIAATTSLLCAAGMGFHDAEFLATLLGLLVFLGLFLWTFATSRPARALAVFAGGGLVLAALGSLVQSRIL